MSSTKVNVVNVKNGKPAVFEKEDWERVKNDPEFKGIWREDRAPKEPAEVTEHKAKQATPAPTPAKPSASPAA